MGKGIFIGRASIDVVHYGDGEAPSDDEMKCIYETKIQTGGPSLTSAIVYSMLGGESLFFTHIGNSLTGKMLKALLSTSGIEIIDLGKTGDADISSVYINEETGKRTIFSGQKPGVNTSAILDKDSFKDADFILFHGIWGERYFCYFKTSTL